MLVVIIVFGAKRCAVLERTQTTSIVNWHVLGSLVFSFPPSQFLIYETITFSWIICITFRYKGKTLTYGRWHPYKTPMPQYHSIFRHAFAFNSIVNVLSNDLWWNLLFRYFLEHSSWYLQGLFHHYKKQVLKKGFMTSLLFGTTSQPSTG